MAADFLAERSDCWAQPARVMPGTDGFEATRAIRADPSEGRRPKVIILTTYDLDEYVFAGLRAGASGFLLKDALADELLTAIRTVVSGLVQPGSG